MINFGPKPNGTFREEEQAVARDMGRWMKLNGEAIYGTRGSTFGKPRWGYITEKVTDAGSHIIYLCMFQRPDSNSIKLAVPRSRVRDLLSPRQSPGTLPGAGRRPASRRHHAAGQARPLGDSNRLGSDALSLRSGHPNSPLTQNGWPAAWASQCQKSMPDTIPIMEK